MHKPLTGRSLHGLCVWSHAVLTLYNLYGIDTYAACIVYNAYGIDAYAVYTLRCIHKYQFCMCIVPCRYFLALALAVGCSAAAFWCLEHLRACELQRAFRDNSQSGYSLELLTGQNAADNSASSDGEKQLLSPGGTELYEDGEDGLRVETSSPPSIMTAVCAFSFR